MKLEENSKLQLEKEMNFLKKEVEQNDDLAIYYLKLYIDRLKNESIKY